MKFNPNPFNSNKKEEAHPHAVNTAERSFEIVDTGTKTALIMLAVGLFKVASAAGPSILLNEKNFADLESKSTTEYQKLVSQMKLHNMDSVSFDDANNKHVVVTYKNGVMTYVESGGGNVFTITDTNGDALVDNINIEGYIDGAEKVVNKDDVKKLDEAHLKRIRVAHGFTKDDQSIGNVDISSTMDLTTAQGQVAFYGTQGKFLKGVSGAVTYVLSQQDFQSNSGAESVASN